MGSPGGGRAKSHTLQVVVDDDGNIHGRRFAGGQVHNMGHDQMQSDGCFGVFVIHRGVESGTAWFFLFCTLIVFPFALLFVFLFFCTITKPQFAGVSFASELSFPGGEGGRVWFVSELPFFFHKGIEKGEGAGEDMCDKVEYFQDIYINT